MRAKIITAWIIDLLIAVVSIVCAVLTYRHIQPGLTQWMIWGILLAVCLGLFIWECRALRLRETEKPARQTVPRIIALMGEEERELRSWPLNGKVGILVGKSEGEILADIDLAACSWSEAIDAAHLAVNYAQGGWWAQDLSSRNGSALIRNEKEILLTPGWPVQIACGDAIVLAGNIRLIVQ